MARSPAEIQADIALTRLQIEQRLDALQRQVERRWGFIHYALLGAGLVTGLLLARVPLLALVGGGARAVQTGVSVAAALAAIDRFLSKPPRLPEAGRSLSRTPPQGDIVRRAS
jgi:hypothetical protein